MILITLFHNAYFFDYFVNDEFIGGFSWNLEGSILYLFTTV